MKPEEAILMMRNRIDTASEIAGKGTDGKAFEDMEIAIEALKEIQQYRKIGTVEECREMASIISKVERNELAKIIDEWLLYKKIGTVEQCREAVEKQKPKKPKEILRHRGGFEMQHCPKCDTDYQVDRRYKIKDGYCPACGKLLDSAFRNYCANCGQAIDEKLEGTEDE